jgi:hypothetical protein
MKKSNKKVGMIAFFIVLVLAALYVSGGLKQITQENGWVNTGQPCSATSDCVSFFISRGAPTAWANDNLRCSFSVCEADIPVSGGAE